MATYDLRGLENDFVVHYGGDDSQIDAFTFANSLTAIGTALQAINKEINPGYSLEVSVTALGGGSFRPHIKAKAKQIGTVLFKEFRQGFVGALGAYLLLQLFDDNEPKTIIYEDSVHIETASGDVIILPPEAYDAYQRAQKSPEVSRSVRQNFETLEEDEAVTSFGFARSVRERENLPFDIGRNDFGRIARPSVPLAPGQRETFEPEAELQILRAIFEDSNRRWQFVWRGVRISAPVLDKAFLKRVVSGKESFRHGDVLIACLRILQSADGTGIWINDTYEVVEVKAHRPRAEQTDLTLD